MNLHPLRSQALEISKAYLRNEKELIVILQKIQKQKLFLEWGYASLFQYAVTELQLAENQAYTLITVSRKCSEVPALQDAIDSGKLTASRARRIVSVIENDNSSLWIEKAATLSQKEIERAVVAVKPEQAVQERIKPISENRSMAVFGMTKELAALLERAKELQAQATGAPCNLEQAIEAMAKFYVKAHDPVQKAERAATRKAKQATRLEASTPKQNTSNQNVPGSSQQTNQQNQSRPKKTGNHKSRPWTPTGQPKPGRAVQMQPSKTLRRHPKPESKNTSQNRRTPIPAITTHQVFLRDKGMCQCKLPHGQICGQRQWTDIHHVRPVSLGGSNHLTNLVTLCRAHHGGVHSKGPRASYLQGSFLRV